MVADLSRTSTAEQCLRAPHPWTITMYIIAPPGATGRGKGPLGQQKGVPGAGNVVPPYLEGVESVSGLGSPQFQPIEGVRG